MLSIAQANIDKFRLLLETEAELTKRALLTRLLDEQTKELVQEQAELTAARAETKKA